MKCLPFSFSFVGECPVFEYCTEFYLNLLSWSQTGWICCFRTFCDSCTFMLAVLAWFLFIVLADFWDWSPGSLPSDVLVAHNIQKILSA